MVKFVTDSISMLKPFWQLGLLAIASIPLALGVEVEPGIAQNVRIEGTITADDLITRNGLSWGADQEDWRFSRVIEIQRDSIDPTVVGRVVLDRHGIDESRINNALLNLFRDPFEGPRPGRVLFISTWGSNNSGCFAEVLLQVATGTAPGNASRIVPVQMEMVINGQRIRLDPQPAQTVRVFNPIPYNYIDYLYEGNTSRQITLSGAWYMTRQLFAVDASTAALLSSAPDDDLNIRLTLSNGSPYTIPIGDGTVRRWRDAFGYNPNCVPGRAGRPVATQPTPAPAPNAVATPPATTSPIAVVNPSVNNPPASNNSPASNPPAPRPNQPPSGDIALASGQTIQDVSVRLESARVTRQGSYALNLVIENNSPRNFGFVPLYGGRIEDETGNTVRSRILFGNGGGVLVEPGGTVQGEVFVIDRRWQGSGSQNLFLIVREGTPGGRTFRVPF